MSYYYSPGMGPGLGPGMQANGASDKPGIYPGGIPGASASQQAQLTQMYGGAALTPGMQARGQQLSQGYPGGSPNYSSATYSQAMAGSSPYVTQGGLYSPYAQQGLAHSQPGLGGGAATLGAGPASLAAGQQSGLQSGLQPSGLQTGLPAGLHAGAHAGMLQPGLTANPYLASPHAAGYGGMGGAPTSVYQGGATYSQAAGLGFPSHATPTYTYPGGRGVPSYPSHLPQPSPSYPSQGPQPSMGHPAAAGFPGGPPYGGRPL